MILMHVEVKMRGCKWTVFMMAGVGLLMFSAACSKSIQHTSVDGSVIHARSRTIDTASAPANVERVTDLVVAKADPSNLGRRQAEEMRRDELMTGSAGLEDVFFGFDQFVLTAAAKHALTADAESLKSQHDAQLLVEGHCDERGTLAYNLVLGEKRGKAVKQFLHDTGVPEMRIAVVSYGKERPFCREHDESCYQKNRRGHLVLRAR